MKNRSKELFKNPKHQKQWDELNKECDRAIELDDEHDRKMSKKSKGLNKNKRKEFMMISAIEEIIYYIEGNIVSLSDDETINLKNFLEDNFAIAKKDK